MAWIGRLKSEFAHSFVARCFSTRGCWHVSSLGRCYTSHGNLTTGTIRNTGYHVVNILGHSFYLHRVVAFAFLGHPPDALTWQVHHIDGDTSNNKVDNLKYVTHSENTQNSYDGNPSRRNGAAVISIPVLGRSLQGQGVWTTWPSLHGAAKHLNVSGPTVARACRRNGIVGNYELKFDGRQEPEFLTGEKWVQMKNPVTGNDVCGRQVSSCGRIKSSRGMISRGHQRKSGYFMAEIYQESQRYSVLVHRLVAYAFLGPPPSLQQCQVNHKDLDPGNNCVDNLEYMTHAENMRHFHANRISCFNTGPRKPILCRLHGSEDEWTSYPSGSHAAQHLGLPSNSISRCVRGLQAHVGLYELKFRPPETPPHPGEEWRPVDLQGLLRERAARLKCGESFGTV